jgi:ankyrin repeat protein
VGNLEIAQLLIKYRAKVNSIRETPVHAVSRFGHLDIVHFLLDYGADVNAKQMDHPRGLRYISRHALDTSTLSRIYLNREQIFINGMTKARPRATHHFS